MGRRFVFILGFAALPLLAQMPPGGPPPGSQMPMGQPMGQSPRGMFPWWDSPLAKDLNLSDEQTKQIRATVQEFRSRLIDLRAAVEKAELNLEDQFNEDTVDARKANEAIDRLVTARGDLTRAFSQMSLKLRSVLTADQWRELQKRRPQMGPGQMRGGMRNQNQRTMPAPNQPGPPQ